MLKTISEVPFQECLGGAGEQLCNTTVHDPETLQLTTGVNKITNTMEERGDNISSLSQGDSEYASGRIFCIKKVMIGGAILTLLGLLTVGISCYQIGRREYTAISDSSLLVGGVNTPNDIQMMTTDSVLTSQYYHSPFSHYEKIYGTATIPEKGLESSAQDEHINKGSLPEISITPFQNNDMINDLADFASKKELYNLDENLYKELDDYIEQRISKIVLQAYIETQEVRCELLSLIVHKMNYYKHIEDTYKDKYFTRGSSLESQIAGKAIVRRKLIALYLAAEFIIDRSRNPNFYHVSVMNDNTLHTSETLMKREKDILNYLSVHDAMNNC